MISLSNGIKATAFAMSCLMSLIMVGFSIEQIIRLEDSESRQVYFSLLSAVVGIWIPSPSSLLVKSGTLDTPNIEIPMIQAKVSTSSEEQTKIITV